ncbi:hypothetical protein DL98DRAFT_529725 [Cadophora sp. DSE1049]|nr:hypothetical protein DL98DRAFT_529725 [Cadophora sp. DSE1049]
MPGSTPRPRSPLTQSSVVSPIPTPSYPTGGLWTILTTTEINAPLSAVLEPSLDVSSWPKWNAFVPKADILSSPDAPSVSSTYTPSEDTDTKLSAGTKATFHNMMKKGTGPADGTSPSPSDHLVASIAPFSRDGRKGFSIVWTTINMPGGEWMLRAERVQEFVERTEEDGRVVTEYRTWGDFWRTICVCYAVYGDSGDGQGWVCEKVEKGFVVFIDLRKPLHSYERLLQDGSAAPRPGHNTFAQLSNRDLPPPPAPQHRIPRSLSLSLELDAIARARGPRRSLQSFTLPDSPTPRSRRTSFASLLLDNPELALQERASRLPLPIYSLNLADRRASMPIAGSDEPWVDQLSNQLSHRHSLIPPVPPIPSMYSSQNLARPRPIGRPPGAVVPRPDYRRPHTPTSRHNPHFPDVDGYYAQAVQDINRRPTNIDEEEDLYGASPPRSRRGASSPNDFSSSRSRPATPTRIPTPSYDPVRTPRMYSPTPRPRSSTVPSLVRAFSSEFDESEATVASSFDRSSASVDKSEQDVTSFSDTMVEDDESDKIDFASLERPRDPVGRSRFDRANEKKPLKKPLFFGKVATSSPNHTAPKELVSKTLRHQNSFFNLKKSSVNYSVETLDDFSTTSDSPTKFDQKVEEKKFAPAVGGKTKDNGSHDRPPTRLGGPRPSRSMFNLRQKPQTPTPRPFVISGPMDVKHVSGSGTALEEVMSRQILIKERASVSNLNKSVTSAQLNGKTSPPMVKSKTTVRFTERTPPRPAKATIFAQNSVRDTLSSKEKSSPTIVEVEGTQFVMLNPPASAKTTPGPTPGMRKSFTSAKIGGRAATPNLTKSSTSAQISGRAPTPNLTKSSTAAQLNGRISALGRWAQRAAPTNTRSASKIKGDKLKVTIGYPYNPIHVSGEGTVFHNVQNEIQAPPQPPPPVEAPQPAVTRDSVISAPFNVVHVSGEAALRKLLDDGRPSAPAPFAQPPRSATPAFGARMPRPSSKARNHFKRSGSSAVVISSPLNPVHVSGDGTAFEEVMGKSTSTNNDPKDATSKISPRRYQSMQDIRARDTTSPTRIPSPIFEDKQGRNFTAPVLPSMKKENLHPTKAHRLLGTISPARVQPKPSNLPLPKSKTFGKLSSLSSSFGRSMVNLAARNQSIYSLNAGSVISLHAEPTTSVSNATATAEPIATPARPTTPHIFTPGSNITMVYTVPEGDNWAGRFSTLRDKFMMELTQTTLRDPKTMQRFQSREESQKKKKKKGKNSDNPFRDDEDFGEVGIDNLLSEEEFRWKRIFMTLESRAMGDEVKESLWRFQEAWARSNNALWLLPACCKDESSSGFMSRVNRAMGRKD